MNYPIVGYAPGSYMCTCVSCKKDFFGDKLACKCERCAINSALEVIEKGDPVHVEQKIYYSELIARLEVLEGTPDEHINKEWLPEFRIPSLSDEAEQDMFDDFRDKNKQ